MSLFTLFPGGGSGGGSAMPRYLFRVQYLYIDGTSSYEPVCVEAATETAALAEVNAATTRYPTAVGAMKTVTLVTTV